MFQGSRAGAAGAQGARRVHWQDSASHWQQEAEREDWVGAREPAIVPLMIASEFGSSNGSGMTSGMSSGMTEDIGVFEEAPSAIPRISTAPAASSEFSDHMVISAGGSGVTSTSIQSSESAAASSATPFVVPKPVLKSGKRPPARGKGVMGTVLAADGSVTHEASRIL
jgi:hypothetical protein